MDKKFDNRLLKANSAFGRLYKRVLNNKNLKTKTKIRIYRAVVLTALLCGSEAWVTYNNNIRLLERFHPRCLHSILNIHWSDCITNVEALETSEVHSIEAMLVNLQLQWAVHVSIMEGNHQLKFVMYVTFL